MNLNGFRNCLQSVCCDEDKTFTKKQLKSQNCLFSQIWLIIHPFVILFFKKPQSIHLFTIQTISPSFWPDSLTRFVVPSSKNLFMVLPQIKQNRVNTCVYAIVTFTIFRWNTDVYVFCSDLSRFVAICRRINLFIHSSKPSFTGCN